MQVIVRPRRLQAIVLAAAVGAALLAAPTSAHAEADASGRGSTGVRPSSVDPDPYLTYRDGDGHYSAWQFATPRGSVRCTVAQYEDSSPWGCFAVRHTWRDPKLPAGYAGSTCDHGRTRQAGALFASGRGARFTVLCRGELPGTTSRGRALPVGAVITVNGITCTSLLQQGREAVRCTAREGGRFTMSRTRLTFQQAKSR